MGEKGDRPVMQVHGTVEKKGGDTARCLEELPVGISAFRGFDRGTLRILLSSRGKKYRQDIHLSAQRVAKGANLSITVIQKQCPPGTRDDIRAVFGRKRA